MSDDNGKAVETLEESFSKLNGIVEKLEQDDLSLEESFKVYQEGMQLLKTCNDKIDTVEKKMMQLNANGEISEL